MSQNHRKNASEIITTQQISKDHDPTPAAAMGNTTTSTGLITSDASVTKSEINDLTCEEENDGASNNFNDISKNNGGCGGSCSSKVKSDHVQGNDFDFHHTTMSTGSSSPRNQEQQQRNTVPNHFSTAPTGGGELEVDPSAINVLLVDDNRLNQLVGKALITKTLRKLLISNRITLPPGSKSNCAHSPDAKSSPRREAKINVDIAKDGVDAVEAAASPQGLNYYHAIFMDIHMPRCGGIDAAKQIRERALGAGVVPPPIIAVTTDHSAETIQQCVEAGMERSILSKPFVIQHLANVLEEHLFSSPQTSPTATTSTTTLTKPAAAAAGNITIQPQPLSSSSSTTTTTIDIIANNNQQRTTGPL